MVTYSLLVKGCEMQAYAQLALKFRGILHKIESAEKDSHLGVNFRVTVNDYDKSVTTRRLSEWFAADIHLPNPLPNGSLLIWSYVNDRSWKTLTPEPIPHP